MSSKSIELVVILIFMAGCIHTQTPADSASPPLPPAGTVHFDEISSSAGDSPSDEAEVGPICAFVSTRQHAGQEREFKGWVPAEETDATHHETLGRSDKPANETVVLNVGDEDLLRIWFLAEEAYRSDASTRNLDYIDEHYHSLGADEFDVDSSVTVLENRPERQKATFSASSEEAYYIEVHVVAESSGEGAVTAELLRKSESAKPEQDQRWRECANNGHFQYYVNME